VKLVVDVGLGTEIAGDQIAHQGAKTARRGFGAAAGNLLVDSERVSDLAPAGRMIGVLQVSPREQLKMLGLPVFCAGRLELAERDRNQALRPRAEQGLVRTWRRVGRERIPTLREGIGPYFRVNRSRLPPPLVDQEIPDRLLQVGPKPALVAVGQRKQAARQDDRFKESLSEIVRLLGVPDNRGDERANRSMVAIRELVEGYSRLRVVARGVRQQIPGRWGEFQGDGRTLLLPVFGGQRT
jgi:hypothetical protein